MSKRGIIFVVLLAVFISSSQVFAVAKISLDKDVVIQSGNVEIKIRPDTAGVYKEIYLIDKQGKIIDSIILDCDAVCYEDKTISYSLPSTIQPGDYKIYVYDYSIKGLDSSSRIYPFESCSISILGELSSLRFVMINLEFPFGTIASSLFEPVLANILTSFSDTKPDRSMFLDLMIDGVFPSETR